MLWDVSRGDVTYTRRYIGTVFLHKESLLHITLNINNCIKSK